jgi:glycosyltransferase involved in cell wall biosynthesis
VRVLHIITGLETGGAEASLYKLIEHFPGPGVDHFVCSLKGAGTYGPRLEALGIPVHALGGTPRSLFRGLMPLARHIKPNLIQGWMYHGNLAATLCGQFAVGRVPVLWNIRQSLIHLRHEKYGTAMAIRLGALLSNRPAKIIYNSYTAQSHHSALGFAAHTSLVIDNGYDTELFKPDAQARRTVRGEIGIDEGVPLIACIGRVHPMKDQRNFLLAAQRVKVATPDVAFLLMGRDTDSAEVTDLVRELGLSAYVRLLGERSDVHRIMAALDLLVLPSWAEAFPNVVGEAMACGVPSVVTDVGDAARIVSDTGIVVPPRDSDALASAILALLERPDRKRLGLRARERIIREYSLMAMVRKYSHVYSEVMVP